MATDFGQILNNSIGGFFGLPKMSSVASVIQHVQSRLSQFAEENRTASPMNEDGLTQRLVKLLNNRHKLPYTFDKESMEDEMKGSSPRSDFAVITNQVVKLHANRYADRERVFTFEAKRLDNLGKAREREYLEGRYDKDKFVNSGGVERFKNGTHGRELDEAGIIGYIQREDFAHWETKIQEWGHDLISRSPVRDEIWAQGDLLQNISSHPSDWRYYQSDCAKNKGTEALILHHIWVNLVA